MPIEIVRNDITCMHVDAIVISANSSKVGESDADSSIYKKAGPELLKERMKLGSIFPGEAAITPAFQLPSRFVIHTVVPVWTNGSWEESHLRSSYYQALWLARQNHCWSIAFPVLAINNDNFPKDKALQIAISVFSEFLLKTEMQIYLVVFDQSTYKLSGKPFQRIADYIEDHYVYPHKTTTYIPEKQHTPQKTNRRRLSDLFRKKTPYNDMFPYQVPHDEPREIPHGDTAAPMAASLSDYLKREDAGFTEKLLNLIDNSGRKDSEIYKRANLSKQLFSKIRNNLNYKPTKQTAVALSLALELDLKQTNDLIGRAGYTLSNSSKFDLIIQYFIEQKNYNVVEINLALYEFDQRLLGS